MTRIVVDFPVSGLGHSFGSRHDDHLEMAGELGITLTRTDNDLSAYSGVERPEYERLVADIAAGQVRTLIFWHANRFLRNTDECNSFIRLARKHSLRVFSYTKGGSTGTTATATTTTTTRTHPVSR